MTAKDDELVARWPPTPSTPDSARPGDLSLVMRGVRDFDGYIVSANPAYHTVLGWSIEELSSILYWQLLHPEDQDRTVEDTQHMLLTGPGSLFDCEVRMLSRDGTYRRVRWNARSIAQQERVYSEGVEVTDSEPTETGKRVLVGSWDWHIPTTPPPGPTGCSKSTASPPAHHAARRPRWRAYTLTTKQLSPKPSSGASPASSPTSPTTASSTPAVISTGYTPQGASSLATNGEPERMRGITQDVTARPEARIPG